MGCPQRGQVGLVLLLAVHPLEHRCQFRVEDAQLPGWQLPEPGGQVACSPPEPPLEFAGNARHVDAMPDRFLQRS